MEAARSLMASSSKVWRGWRGLGTTEAVRSSSITLAPVGISAPRPRPRPVLAVIRLLLLRGRRRGGGRTPATVPTAPHWVWGTDPPTDPTDPQRVARRPGPSRGRTMVRIWFSGPRRPHRPRHRGSPSTLVAPSAFRHRLSLVARRGREASQGEGVALSG